MEPCRLKTGKFQIAGPHPFEKGKAFFLEPLNTNPVLKAFRVLTRPFRPNLIWEHPFSTAEIKNFVSEFEKYKIHYFEALSMLSLLFAYEKTLFDLANKQLRKVDKTLTSFPPYTIFFTKAAGSGLSGLNLIVPFDVSNFSSSVVNLEMTDGLMG